MSVCKKERKRESEREIHRKRDSGGVFVSKREKGGGEREK